MTFWNTLSPQKLSALRKPAKDLFVPLYIIILEYKTSEIRHQTLRMVQLMESPDHYPEESDDLMLHHLQTMEEKQLLFLQTLQATLQVYSDSVPEQELLLWKQLKEIQLLLFDQDWDGVYRKLQELVKAFQI